MRIQTAGDIKRQYGSFGTLFFLMKFITATQNGGQRLNKKKKNF